MVRKGWSDREEVLKNTSIPHSFTEMPPEAVMSRVEAGCTCWVLLGILPVSDFLVLWRGKLCGNSNTPYSLLSSTNTSQSIFTFTALTYALKPLTWSLNDRYSCFCSAFFLVPFNNSYSSTPHSRAPFHCSFDN